jgi:cell division protein FtsB
VGSSRAPAGPRFTSRAIVLGVVLLVLVISYASSLRAWLDQREQIAETREQISSVRQQVDDLERERRRWADDAYVEQQARARLDFVMPGETGYRVITPDGATIDTQVDPRPSDQAAPRDWYETMWASARRAGRAG